MKKIIVIVGIVLVIVAVVTGISMNGEGANAGVPIRIGWSVAWMPQAQVVEVLQHTSILEKNGLLPSFEKFTAGPPLTEAALAGNLDVIFVGYIPALSLASKIDKWEIVSRISDGRGAIIVPEKSNINSINDLKGKTFAVPFATLPHIMGIKALKDIGINPDKDITIKNIDAVEGLNVIQKGTASSWSGIDAFGTWDPNLSKLEEMGKSKIIIEFPLNGVIVMSKDFYTKHPKEATNFLKSMIEGYNYYLGNMETANNWYLKDTGMNYSSGVIARTVSIERNNKAKNIQSIDLVLNQTDIEDIQTQADEGYASGVIKKKITATEIVDQSFIKKAQTDIADSKYTETVETK